LQHKEELIKEIEYQLTLGVDSLAEEDRFLLECNFDYLATAAGEFQEYWLLAIRAAREASCLSAEANEGWQYRPRKRQRQA
jgi:hypothetical protein